MFYLYIKKWSNCKEKWLNWSKNGICSIYTLKNGPAVKKNYLQIKFQENMMKLVKALSLKK